MRKSILAVLSVVVVSVAGCKSLNPNPSRSEQFSNPCLSRGVVCVDPKSKNVSQNPIHIHGGDFAHFFITDGNGVLTITCEPGPPIEYVRQDGSHVVVKTMPVKAAVSRKYLVEINGRTLDPEMVIEP
jgi:hypothetical protein